MWKVFWQCFYYDVRVVLADVSQWFHPLIFLVLFTALFGVSVGIASQEWTYLSSAIIWINFLLTSLFAIESLFQQEKAEGALTRLLLSPHPLWWLVLAKLSALWCSSCLPLILFSPLLCYAMHLSNIETFYLFLSLLIGSPALVAMGVLGASFTIALSRSGVLLGILLLPLYVPILILGQSVIYPLFTDGRPYFQLWFLAAISIFSITALPHVAAAALKLSMDE